MIDAFSIPRNRIKALILLVVCGLLTIAAAAVGVDDNPPGILLAYLDPEQRFRGCRLLGRDFFSWNLRDNIYVKPNSIGLVHISCPLQTESIRIP